MLLISQFKYDGLTAFYYILCSMSDKMIDKFRNTWFTCRTFIDDSMLTVPTNGAVSVQIVASFSGTFILI